MTGDITDNPTLGRFELSIDGRIVFATYRRDGDVVYLPHVEAPPSLRGTGAAGRLMQGIMDHARAQGLRVAPICGYAAAWLRRHREYDDLVVGR